MKISFFGSLYNQQINLFFVFLSAFMMPYSKADARLTFGGGSRKTWTSSSDWKSYTVSKNINYKAKGEIKLEPNATKRAYLTPYIYIPNSNSNTLVQLDSKTGKKRWLISLDSIAKNGDPSRTTVDINGNVWVGLRNSEKIALINKEGKILRIVKVGRIPRAITIALNGNIWAGSWKESTLTQINGTTGQILKKIKVKCPYGATTDIFGNIWVVNRCSGTHSSISKISPTGTLIGTYKADGAYGIATDQKGQVWVANINKGCLHRFQNNGQHNGCYSIGSGCTTARGVAVDRANQIWVACSNTPLITKFSDTGKVLGFSTEVGQACVGLAIDAEDHIWAISLSDSIATKIETKTLKMVGKYKTYGRSPYTYSDMTGFQFQSVAKSIQGVWRTTYNSSCPSRWKKVSWNAKIPHGTQLFVRVRVAATQKLLAKAQWTAPLQSGATPRVPHQPWIEIEIQMKSFNQKITPIVTDLTVEFVRSGQEVCNGKDDNCDGIIDNDPKATGPLTKACTSSCGKGVSPCIRGQWIGCTAPTPQPESCDNLDNDCNGKIDDKAKCKSLHTCFKGQCVLTCEQPCPKGTTCKTIGKQKLCVGNKTCAEQKKECNKQHKTCAFGRCVIRCKNMICPKGFFCTQDRCLPENCYQSGRTCPSGQRCIAGKCKKDPCQTAKCKINETCNHGQCLQTCSQDRCSDKQICIKGKCQPNPCAEMNCQTNEVCIAGKCKKDPCQDKICQKGQACINGSCQADPCEKVTCPYSYVCRPPYGDCYPLPPGKTVPQEFYRSNEQISYWPTLKERFVDKEMQNDGGASQAQQDRPFISYQPPPSTEQDCNCSTLPHRPSSLLFVLLVCIFLFRQKEIKTKRHKNKENTEDKSE